MASLKDKYMSEIDEQFDTIIAPIEDRLDIPSFDGDEVVTDEMPF